MYAEKLHLGFTSRSDSVVSSMTGKAEGGKKETSIKPGDLLVLEEASNVTTATKASADKACCVYGVAAVGIQGFTVPVVTKGHVIANLDSTVFTNIKVGEALTCTKGAQKCCCNVFVVQKLKALKPNNTLQDAYEILIRR